MNNFIFDIDGTLRNFEPKPDIHPGLYGYLQKLKLEGNIYVVTGRTYNNFRNFLEELTISSDNLDSDIFSQVFCEDGHISYRNDLSQILINKENLEQLDRVRGYVETSMTDNRRKNDISLPNSDLVSEVAITIQGLSEPMKFDNQIRKFIKKERLRLLKINKLTHNRLSISIKGVSKYSAIKSTQLDLSKTTFFCDELNDLELAVNVKKSGGKVVAPENAIQEIKLIADYLSPMPHSHGVVDYLDRYFKKSSY